jgi:hypothetical protein
MNAYFFDNETQTIRDVSDSKVTYFGYRDFMKDIVDGDNCFICGCSPSSKEFNDEHIIPDWILRKFDLHNDQIALPNGTYIRYGQYKVPCCEECNSNLGKLVERPLSMHLSNSYSDLIKEIKKDSSIIPQLFIWMCLLYIKTHLKDKSLLQERDKRKEAGKIGDIFEWSEMHHVHCMSRVYHTGAIVHEHVYGSILILPALSINEEKQFDYMDSAAAQTGMIQLGNICIISVLNDSCACQTVLSGVLKKISGPLTPFQLKEIFAHMVYINLHLKERPKFHSTISKRGYEIEATLPETLELIPEKEQIISLGELLYFYIDKFLSKDTPDRDALLQSIRKGKRRYLLNEKDEFIDNSII